MSIIIRYKATGHKRLVADFVARNLIANNIATLASDSHTYETRQMTPERDEIGAEVLIDPITAVPTAPTGRTAIKRNAINAVTPTERKKRTYKRRDLKAKD